MTRKEKETPTVQGKIRLQLTIADLVRGAKVVEAQLVNETESHASVLEHVVKREGVDGIGRRVDVGAGEVKRRLNHKCRGIPGLGSRGVIRASIAALSLDVGDVAVLQGE